MKTYDLVIIGGGPAGLYAASCAGMRHINVLLIEATKELGGKLKSYKEKLIFDIPAIKEIKANELVENLKSQMDTYKEHIDISFENDVLDMKLNDGFILKLKDIEVCTKYILITHGAGRYNPRKLEVDGAKGNKNIIYNIDNPNIFKNESVVVLGGGDSAVDFVLMLQDIAEKVYLIHRRNDFRAKDDSLSKIKKNVDVLTSFDVTKVDKSDLFITNKNTHEEKSIKFDKMVVAYGVLPSEDYFSKNLTLDQKGIVVDRAFMTSIEGIYAIGDACFYEGKNKNISSAFGEGSNVISIIANKLNPNKNPQFYSSINKE